jgi:lipopolysaccharide export system permease protein
VKVLDRYVLWNFAVSAFVAFTFTITLFVVVHFFANMDRLEMARQAFAARGVGLFTGLCRYYALTMPFVLAKLGPFAVLLAAMWTLQRMVRDQEIAAAQAAGVSLHRLIVPLFAGGAVLALALATVRQDLLPRLATESHELERFLKGKSEAVIEGPLLLKDRAGALVLLQSFEPATQTARGVHFRSADLSRSLDLDAMRWDAATASWQAVDAAGRPSALPWETDVAPRDIVIDARGGRFLSSEDLDELTQRLPGRHDLALMRHLRVTYPLSTVVLLMLGVPLVLRREQRSVYAAWAVCLLVSILYFAAENVLHGLAVRDKLLSPALAAWIPIAVFGIVGTLAYQDL